jgi:hypothetical protein
MSPGRIDTEKKGIPADRAALQNVGERADLVEVAIGLPAPVDDHGDPYGAPLPDERAQGSDDDRCSSVHWGVGGDIDGIAAPHRRSSESESSYGLRPAAHDGVSLGKDRVLAGVEPVVRRDEDAWRVDPVNGERRLRCREALAERLCGKAVELGVPAAPRVSCPMVEAVERKRDSLSTDAMKRRRLGFVERATARGAGVERTCGERGKYGQQVGDPAVRENRMEPREDLRPIPDGLVERAVVRELVDAKQDARRALCGVAEHGAPSRLKRSDARPLVADYAGLHRKTL